MRRIAPGRTPTRPQVVAAVQTAAGDRPIAAISVVLVGDEEIAGLHAQFMDDPTATDVLTFDLRDDTAVEALEGEIVVSVETAARQARRLRLPGDEEVLRYVIHGTLHLVGYDDHTPAGRRTMRRQENRVLGELRERGVLADVGRGR